MDAEMTVRDVMSRGFVGVSESDPVDSTVELMFEEGAECVVVLRGEEPVGTMSERDVLAATVAGALIEDATVAEVMDEAVRSIRSDRDLAVGIERLATAEDARLIVTGDTSPEPIGLLTYRDVATTIAHSLRSGGRSQDIEAAGLESGWLEDGGVEGTDEETIQSICESCGALAGSLASVDGRLLCGNCRSV